MVIVSIIKILLVCNLPVRAAPNSVHDSWLMVKTAKSLMEGQWLGNYTDKTLIKGPFFPLFLAFSKTSTLSYLFCASFFYLVGCWVFTFAVRGIFDKNIYLAILFIVLAFNPISFDSIAFQRIYRGSMSPTQVLLICGCLFAVFLRRENSLKKLLPWLITAGFALASMWLTREDSIWILPFVLLMLALTAFMLIYHYYQTRKKTYLINAASCLLPIIILQCCLAVVSAINYAHYGIFTTNEINNSNFTKAMRSIYSVKPSEVIDYVSVPRSTVKTLYKLSPSLSSIRKTWEPRLDGWEQFGKVPGDNEVEDGWFFWSLRHAVAAAGMYRKAQIADNFYLKVHIEIDQALKEKKAESRATMPSALMSPWRSEYGKKLPAAITKAFKFVATFDMIGSDVVYSEIPQADIVSRNKVFEYISGNTVLYKDSDSNKDILPAMSRIVKRCRIISDLYKATGFPSMIMASIAYLLLTISMVISFWKKDFSPFASWLIPTGIALCPIALFMGVAYTAISAFSAINSQYLSGAYPLLSAFTCISLMLFIQKMVNFFKTKVAMSNHP